MSKTMKRHHHKNARETRKSLETVIDVKPDNRTTHSIPAGEASLAKLASDLDLTIDMTQQQIQEAKDISRHAGSTS